MVAVRQITYQAKHGVVVLWAGPELGEGWVSPVETSGNLMPLRDFVAALRAELLAAHDDGQASENPERSPRFVVGPVNVEFTVAAKKEGGAKGGIRFYVFELGASGSVGTESTQRVSLTLTPVTKDNDPYDVADTLPFKPK